VGTKTAPQPVDFARLAVEVASENQAADIAMLDIRAVSDFADYFVIMTADSARQIDALVRDIEEALERAPPTGAGCCWTSATLSCTFSSPGRASSTTSRAPGPKG